MSATRIAVHQNKQRLINEGIEQGAFEMALKIKRNFGLEKALELSDFSRQKLENEKLNR
ncbi:hypothetical protein [uncultured Methanobrevibacter sp.]|uniref:hypothetical protein n=1 Tax=uncultured Methanobrevibacter sp. TaxID=253161 RepID=UPI0026129DA1|nr:hypothetical protein [uncultured Methanobrevibacter sp.]